MAFGEQERRRTGESSSGPPYSLDEALTGLMDINADGLPDSGAIVVEQVAGTVSPGVGAGLGGSSGATVAAGTIGSAADVP